MQLKNEGNDPNVTRERLEIQRLNKVLSEKCELVQNLEKLKKANEDKGGLESKEEVKNLLNVIEVKNTKIQDLDSKLRFHKNEANKFAESQRRNAIEIMNQKAMITETSDRLAALKENLEVKDKIIDELNKVGEKKIKAIADHEAKSKSFNTIVHNKEEEITELKQDVEMKGVLIAENENKIEQLNKALDKE